MTIHVLKTDGEPFGEVACGRKPFEIRRDDRTPPFERGDLVILVNNSPGPGYGGRLLRRIGYLYRGRHVPEGYCVFELLQAAGGDDVRADVVMGELKVST